MGNLAPHGGCNWQGCTECFPSVAPPNPPHPDDCVCGHEGCQGETARAEQADPSKGERWCGTHRMVEVGPCPDYQLPTLDADDIKTIRGALEYVSVVLAGTEMSAANLPRLTAIVRAQAKLDMIGDGGTFVATPF